MKGFIKLINEINYNYSLILLFETLLGSIVIFLFAYAILIVLNQNAFIAVYPAVAYLIIASYNRIKRKHIKDVEAIDPELNERLRTAADNLKVENPVVDELQYEIMKEIKNVGIASFMSQKTVSMKVLGSILLSFLILTLAITGFKLDFDLSTMNPTDYIYRPFSGNNSGGNGEGNVRTAGGDGSQEIFGEENVAGLGENKFYVALAKTSYELSLDDVKEPEKKVFTELFPLETFGQASETFEEDIPKEQQEIVKNYFEKISKK